MAGRHNASVIAHGAQEIDFSVFAQTYAPLPVFLVIAPTAVPIAPAHSLDLEMRGSNNMLIQS